MQYGDGLFVKELCQSFDLHAEPDLIRSNTNLIYDCGDSILRLTPNSFRAPEEVSRELHWLSYVGRYIDGVVRVLGKTPTSTKQFVSGNESFTVTRLERIDGRPVEKHQWNSSHFERLGALAGKMHRIGQVYSPMREVDLYDWNGVPGSCLDLHLPDDGRGFPRINKILLEFMTTLPRNSVSYGPIHYDIHPGNYLMTSDNRLVLFDFENSCRGHYVNDVAVVLYYARLHRFSGDADDFSRTFLDSFWRGYGREYPIARDEVESLPWFLLNRGLILYSYLFKIWPDELDDEQEACLKRVEQGISRDRMVLAI